VRLQRVGLRTHGASPLSGANWKLHNISEKRMKNILSAAIIASFCLVGTSVHAQDKNLSLPSGQQKITPDTPMGKTAREGTSGTNDTMKSDGMKRDGMMHGGKMIDSNGDGMISKAEFTKHHDAMWASMKKDSKGMVSTTDFQAGSMTK